MEAGSDMMYKLRSLLLLLAIFSGSGARGMASTAAEARVLDYVRAHLQPG